MTSRTTRSIAAGAAALLMATGMAAVTGPAVAGAAPTECATAQTVTIDGYTFNKVVVGDGTAAPGGTVTFQTTVTGPGALVTRIEDFHPAGFELISARSNVYYLIGGQKWEDVTSDVKRDSAANSIYLTSTGWTTANARVTLETTYRVPADATPGQVLDTGAAANLVLVNGRKEANPIGTCVTIRQANPVEAVTGSLDGLGLGSLTSGSSALGDIGADPASFSADLINGVDIGQLIGGLAGS